MSNFKRKATHRQHKGCGLCDQHKRHGNSVQRLEGKRQLKRELILAKENR